MSTRNGAMLLLCAAAAAGCAGDGGTAVMAPMLAKDAVPVAASKARAEDESVSGRALFMDFEGTRRTASFQASRGADGSVRGSWKLDNDYFALKLRGTVTCLAVAGNEVRLGGLVVANDGSVGPGPGDAVVWTAVDNGKGKHGLRDEISTVYNLGPDAPAVHCGTERGIDLVREPIDHGEVTIGR